jgi:hypothetical protein
MKQALAAYTNVIAAWDEFIEHVKVHRSNEVNINQWGFGDIDIANIGIPWASLRDVFSLPDESSDIAFEKKLVQHLNSMRDRLNEAKNHGVGWLLTSSPFLNDVSEVSQMSFVLIPAVRGMESQFRSLEVEAGKIAVAEAKSSRVALASTLKEIEANRKVVDDITNGIGNKKDALDLAAKKLEEAGAKLEKATADLNKQGLAGAFSDAAIKFNGQRKLFGGGFLLAICLIVGIGYDNRLALSNIGSDLKFLGVVLSASPWVWLGWFCVRQLGQMTRIQQDYEFKTATALAFEAHKRELATGDGADVELSKLFLKTVVQNFGENPVRLLPDSRNEHGHPIEELISNVSDEKVFDRVIKLIESVKKTT